MVGLRFRSHWRHRWGTLLALTLLIGVVGATVLATVAGARRTNTVVERMDAKYKVPDTFALFDSDSFAQADAILASPVVASGDRLVVFGAFSETDYIPLVASVDGKLGSEMHFDRLLRGRRPHSNAPLEVALPELTAARNGLDVGSNLPFHAAGPDQAKCITSDSAEDQGDPLCLELDRALEADEPDWTVFDGPSFELEVVGISRELDQADRSEEGALPVYLSPAFFEQYQDSIPFFTGVVARFRPGVTDQDFEAALAEVVGPETLSDFTYSSTSFDGMDATASTLANGLLVFGGVAAVAGLVAIAQAIARQAAAAAADGRVLTALGVTRTGRVLDLLVPLVPLSVGGALLAVIGAWVVSPIMPIGTPRDIEVAKGFDFDVPVLFVGGALLAGFVLGSAWVAAGWIGRPSRATRPARFAAGLPASVPTGLGVRWALYAGRAQRAIPIRSAIAGVALGVAGIVAVAGFAEGLERLTRDPARSGWGWDVAVTGERAEDSEVGSTDTATQDEQAARILADPDVEGVVLGWLQLRAPVGGRSVPAFAERRYAGDVGFVVVDGRSPQGADEVALGAKTMRHAGVGIGDEVSVADAMMRVVGQAVFPDAGDGFPLAEGALFSYEGMKKLGLDTDAGDQSFRRFGVTFRDGADGDAVRERLAELNGDEPPDESRQPTELRQLGQLKNLPAYLAIFLFVVASLALTHALVLTVRRRRRDVAVVRSLGATRSQSSRTIAWQASTIAIVGVAIGLPLGVIIGRTVWGAVARSYGVADDSAWPVFAIVVALPAALLVANAIAWWPGRRAARIVPSEALRTE